MRLWLFCLAAIACQAQTEVLSPELAILADIRAKVAENLARLPNYTCLEQIRRERKRALAHSFEPLDLVRVEVALIGGKELFGWPDGDRISESEISRLVRGTIGDGDFALLTKSVFFTKDVTYRSRGMVKLKGRPAVQFDYEVPLQTSGYRLRVALHEAVVPYHGSFWVDPDTLDLRRIEIVADKIPAFMGIVSTFNTMEFAQVHIAGAPFLLPQRTQLSVSDEHGWESRNRIEFDRCRQYAGESKLSFAEEEAEAPGMEVPQESREPEDLHVLLPETLSVDLSLDTEIDSRTAAVGDLVRASLLGGIKTRDSGLIPKGAEAEGRIARFERSSDGWILDINVRSIAFDGKRIDLSGRENVVSLPVSWRNFRIAPPSVSMQNAFVQSAAPIVMHDTRVKLKPGIHLNLKSKARYKEHE